MIQASVTISALHLIHNLHGAPLVQTRSVSELWDIGGDWISVDSLCRLFEWAGQCIVSRESVLQHNWPGFKPPPWGCAVRQLKFSPGKLGIPRKTRHSGGTFTGKEMCEEGLALSKCIYKWGVACDYMYSIYLEKISFWDWHNVCQALTNISYLIAHELASSSRTSVSCTTCHQI